ncbi:MAG: hypothetical protein V7K94_02350, partial [Nostoc sp.]|uniref:hypothetical protein n=1 Tax=Nostoc sp. TaxID=1180 RepID=UPI002FFB3E5E
TSAHIFVTSVDAFSVFTYLYIVWFFRADLLIAAILFELTTKSENWFQNREHPNLAKINIRD